MRDILLRLLLCNAIKSVDEELFDKPLHVMPMPLLPLMKLKMQPISENENLTVNGRVHICNMKMNINLTELYLIVADLHCICDIAMINFEKY